MLYSVHSTHNTSESQTVADLPHSRADGSNTTTTLQQYHHLITQTCETTPRLYEQQKCSKTRASTEHCDCNTQKERTHMLDLEARDLHCATRALWRTWTWQSSRPGFKTQCFKTETFKNKTHTFKSKNKLKTKTHSHKTLDQDPWDTIILVKVKVKKRIVLRVIHLRTTGHHLSMGSHSVICRDRPTFTPTGQVGTQFIDPVRMKGWVGLVGWLHTEMVYPSADGHPSEY